MRIALVTTATPAAGAGRAADGLSLCALLPYLREIAEVELFAEPGRALAGGADEGARSLVELAPRAFDQILYDLRNERGCGFMLPAIRALGGTVALRGWELGEAARGAYASLERGGWRGFARALAEGGLSQARTWSRLRRAGPEFPAASPALNRSAVRFGDAFLVHAEPLRARILAERNEPTPIALLPPPPPPPSGEPADAGPAEQLARAYVQALERFPHARSARRSLVVLAFRARTAARRARARGPAAPGRPERPET